MLLDLGRCEQGAGDGGAAVQGVAAQNGGIVPSRNLKESQDIEKFSINFVDD